jgi:glycosyltransferase involved in cell wall biosynthesis
LTDVVTSDRHARGVLDVSVVVPVRNAETFIDDCLASLVRSSPREVIVVDGLSSDRTLEIVRRYPVQVLSDDGRGLPAARLVGAQAAESTRVALVDADVVLPPGALEALVEEFEEGEYVALQAGLQSISGPGYWGRALVHHHRSGRSKNWVGLAATIFDRNALLEHGFDARFLSGEDWELRWRLERAGASIGVSRRTIVIHRFDDTFRFARGQWLADGRGLARLVRKQGWRASYLLALPLLAAVRGIAFSLLRRQPRWIPYYVCYGVFNYSSIVGQLARGRAFRHAAGDGGP